MELASSQAQGSWVRSTCGWHKNKKNWIRRLFLRTHQRSVPRKHIKCECHETMQKDGKAEQRKMHPDILTCPHSSVTRKSRCKEWEEETVVTVPLFSFPARGYPKLKRQSLLQTTISFSNWSGSCRQLQEQIYAGFFIGGWLLEIFWWFARCFI